ncbi:efflux RND transporter periplasmic adaptor subunit [Agriterribacter sp.]|uniref:efflux RND transporter periplasmic adaptor subunit n=1 Tax=Agriterribacter sp. TaxID=2821509 RepID=UPI002CCA0A64|nr:efflux RND transporter periplasmic adaptor subunit [Agriterribacter sp.]HRO46730.1 efflux RND transporter periplasmic adaptor subunit [Agriterribacter sp.]
MKKYLIIVITAFVIAPSFISCSGKGNAEAASAEELKKTGEGEHEDEHENTNTTSLSDAQLKSIGIELGGIEEKQLTASLKANGVLKVPNQNKASVNSVYNGVIKSLLVQPGSRVSKGQVIATVTNPEFVQVQSDYLNVSAKIGLAELEVKRQKELNAGNAGALKNLQAAETELSTLRTAKSTYEQQILLMGINPANLSNGKLISVLSIKSPISGEVSDVKVEMGSYVDFSTAVARIVDNSQLHLDLFVYEKDIPKLKNNQLIHFTLTNNPGKEYDAQIYSLGSSFEGESKAVTVHAKVQGDKTGLIDGMTITAAISLNRKSKPAVPTDAIVTVAGQDYIFMVTDEHAEPALPAGGEEHHEEGNHKEEKGLTFEKIPVVKGTTDVGYTEITLLKAIPKDAKIVVKGAFFVLAKMTNAGEGEHGH